MLKLTALIEKSEDGWYVGQVEEMPAAISQGKTIEEVKKAIESLMVPYHTLLNSSL